MAEEKKYQVKGTYEGQELDEIVYAYSDKQAKFKAGIQNGINGQRLSGFMRDTKIKAIRRL